MTTFWHCLWLASLLSSAALAGDAAIRMPFVTGHINTEDENRAPVERPLSAPQLRGLEGFFSAHRYEWSGYCFDAAARLPRSQTDLSLESADGKVTSVSIQLRPTGERVLSVSSTGTSIYRAAAGLIRCWRADLALNLSDYQELQKLLAPAP